MGRNFFPMNNFLHFFCVTTDQIEHNSGEIVWVHFFQRLAIQIANYPLLSITWEILENIQGDL